MAIIHQFGSLDQSVLSMFETARTRIFRPKVAVDKAAHMQKLVSRAITLSGENPHDFKKGAKGGSGCLKAEG